MPSAIRIGRPTASRAAPPTAPRAAGDERRQGQDAAFALVVRAHHDRDVLDRDDEQQRVDDQREHAQHVVVRRRHRVRAEEALAHRIQRAGADVAVDDAESGEGEGKQAAPFGGTQGAPSRSRGARSAMHRRLWQRPRIMRGNRFDRAADLRPDAVPAASCTSFRPPGPRRGNDARVDRGHRVHASLPALAIASRQTRALPGNPGVRSASPRIAR